MYRLLPVIVLVVGARSVSASNLPGPIEEAVAGVGRAEAAARLSRLDHSRDDRLCDRLFARDPGHGPLLITFRHRRGRSGAIGGSIEFCGTVALAQQMDKLCV